MDILKETKSSLIEKIHEKSDFKLADIKKVVEMFFEEVEASLVKGVAVEFRGFGVFSVNVRKARKNVRNPRTGEIIKMKDARVVRFKVGKNLKDAVKNTKKAK